jgi:hypothetical protein
VRTRAKAAAMMQAAPQRNGQQAPQRREEGAQRSRVTLNHDCRAQQPAGATTHNAKTGEHNGRRASRCWNRDPRGTRQGDRGRHGARGDRKRHQGPERAEDPRGRRGNRGKHGHKRPGSAPGKDMQRGRCSPVDRHPRATCERGNHVHVYA